MQGRESVGEAALAPRRTGAPAQKVQISVEKKKFVNSTSWRQSRLRGDHCRATSPESPRVFLTAASDSAHIKILPTRQGSSYAKKRWSMTVISLRTRDGAYLTAVDGGISLTPEPTPTSFFVEEDSALRCADGA